jgi:hypothetical protein
MDLATRALVEPSQVAADLCCRARRALAPSTPPSDVNSSWLLVVLDIVSQPVLGTLHDDDRRAAR